MRKSSVNARPWDSVPHQPTEQVHPHGIHAPRLVSNGARTWLSFCQHAVMQQSLAGFKYDTAVICLWVLNSLFSKGKFPVIHLIAL